METLHEMVIAIPDSFLAWPNNCGFELLLSNEMRRDLIKSGSIYDSLNHRAYKVDNENNPAGFFTYYNSNVDCGNYIQFKLLDFEGSTVVQIIKFYGEACCTDTRISFLAFENGKWIDHSKEIMPSINYGHFLNSESQDCSKYKGERPAVILSPGEEENQLICEIDIESIEYEVEGDDCAFDLDNYERREIVLNYFDDRYSIAQ